MNIPDELLDYLADRYYREYIDPRKCKFATWVAIEAEKLGFRL